MHYNYYRSILLLENGTKYHGWSLNKWTLSIGEIVFNTGMTGYQEIITDPSYANQIITFTYPEIGNTGINIIDNEADKIHIKGIITKNLCETPSNWQKSICLAEYLLNNNIPHIFGIDTRKLTRNLRDTGVMNGCISSTVFNLDSLVTMIEKTPDIKTINLIRNISTTKIYKYEVLNKKNFIYSYLQENTNINHGKSLNIIVIDFGVKNNILSRLSNYGCQVHVVPASSTYETIFKYQPDGILISNGPGDPFQMKTEVNNIRELINRCNIPIFGICMGHQILSLALGGDTFKLKFGHRGLNHPAGMHQTAKITSQNHGFAVKTISVVNTLLQINHSNLNDMTIGSTIHRSKPIFSVQYHPEASPGPHDCDYYFYHFITLIRLGKAS